MAGRGALLVPLLGSLGPRGLVPAAVSLAPALSRGWASSAQPAQEEEDDGKIACTVNGVDMRVAKGSTVMAACEEAGIDVPRFCYHPKLSIAGNCRMCLVEVTPGPPKPAASCAMPLMPGMNIKTDSPMVKKAREGVMEFLLLNHPLDCPICDQGGECDLQDQAMAFGSDRSRFIGNKRSVVDKNLGPLVKTVMTRCIHCTRCVRFATEVAGVQDLGMTGRGGAAEIGTYVEKLLNSEMSGNVIDLCPVGALTSKPFAFTARQWELKGTETIDVSDALGCNIRVDSRGNEVLRVVPRANEAVNEEWISDKARFQYDALSRQRLNVPLVRSEKTGKLEPAKWEAALTAVAEKLKGAKGDAKALAGKLACSESLVALKDLMNRLGCEDVRCEGALGSLQADARSSYVFNSTIAGVDGADAILLVGSNPRVEAPVLNARLRRANYEGVPVGILGEHCELTYDTIPAGQTLDQLPGSDFDAIMKKALKPMVIVGPGVLARPDRDAVLARVAAYAAETGALSPGWCGFNVLHDSASRVAALDLGLSGVPSEGAKPAKLVYLLGADDFDASEIPEGAFVVYQGHHGDKGANIADVILPGAAYTEKPGTYVNSEGRVQQARRCVPPLGEARDDWKILAALAEVAGAKLPYDTLDGVRARLAEIAPHFAKVDQVQGAAWVQPAAPEGGDLSPEPFKTPVSNFYMTDAISRASLTMAKATQAKAEMTHGKGAFS